VRLTGSTADLDRDRFHPMDEGSAVIAAMTAAAGDDILDLAAAPGGKSILMRHLGRQVVSNDVSLPRLRPLMGRGAAMVVSDGRVPAFARQFQTVLLDAPCSATGTIRKNPEIKWRLRESDLGAFATLQRGWNAACCV
jgi:16S rRNA (cytosine967-C5)-methyltransferase